MPFYRLYFMGNFLEKWEYLASVQQSLLGKLGGAGEAETDPGYEAGLGGLLDTGGGDTFNLGGSGIQETVTEQVCDLVLEHGQSFL